MAYSQFYTIYIDIKENVHMMVQGLNGFMVSIPDWSDINICLSEKHKLATKKWNPIWLKT